MHQTAHAHENEHENHDGASDHGHSHGLVDRSIVRSRAGVRTVAISLAVLALTAAAQVVIFVLSNSVALLADLIHNFGDALTAVPLGIAFYLRSFRGEKLAGLAVVLAIFVSACVALYETIQRLIHPQQLTHLWTLAAAGAIGFLGNEIAAQVRLRGGRRLSSPALIADGNHARIDGFVSLGVVASAIAVALGQHRRPDHRPRHHPRHPQDHLGLLAHRHHHRARRTRRPARALAATATSNGGACRQHRTTRRESGDERRTRQPRYTVSRRSRNPQRHPTLITGGSLFRQQRIPRSSRRSLPQAPD
jgi:Co/Zn/Cd efflux system component